MYTCGNFEDQVARAKSKAEYHRKAAALFPAVRKVVEKFDGKVYNCRFDKAMQDLGTEEQHIYCYKQSGRWVNVYIYGAHGYNDQYTVLSLDLEKMENKRIVAEKVIEEMREKRADHLKRANELENSAEKVKRIKDRMEEIDREVSAMMKSVSYEVQDVYSMNYRLMNN